MSKISEETLGLIYGDGSLKSRISFANSEPSLVTRVLDDIKKFPVAIKIHVKTFSDPQRSLSKWRGSLNKYQLKFYKPSKYYGNSTSDLAEIIIDNAELRDQLRNNIKEVINKGQKIQKSRFLTGVFAAEGSVKLWREKNLRELRFASVHDQDTLRKLLKDVGIECAPAMYKNYIAISGYNNFSKFKQLNLHKLHPNKKEKFEFGFYNLTISRE